MPSFAIRMTPEILAMIETLTGNSTDVFDEIPYFVFTPIDATEFKLKLMTEDQMFNEFKDNSELEIVTL